MDNTSRLTIRQLLARVADPTKITDTGRVLDLVPDRVHWLNVAGSCRYSCGGTSILQFWTDGRKPALLVLDDQTERLTLKQTA